MDLAPAPQEHPARTDIRNWLEQIPSPTPRQLAEAGYVAPHWPRPWGRGAGPVEQLVIDEELRRAGVRRPSNPIGIGWAGPTIIHAGTQEQKDRYLLPLLSGEETWCQLFSEPGSGSDLASLATRAIRDGDEWLVEGQKVWTSFAQGAAFGILLVRTDPDAEKRRGISYFICPMDAAGVTVRPIVDMTGARLFNEVFLDGVRLPSGNLVGEVNGGWALAKVTLGNERVSLSGEGALWGQGPTARDLLDLVGRHGPVRDALMRERLARLWSEGEILRLIRLRTVGAQLSGRPPGPESSVRKALADAHGQRIMQLAVDIAGSWGMLDGGGPQDGLQHRAENDHGDGRHSPSLDSLMWAKGFQFSPALTIGGGTAEVQRNIIAERVLGLPSDHS